MRRTRTLTTIGLILLVSGCSTQPTAPGVRPVGPSADTAACVGGLAGESQAAYRVLDGDDITVVNWNIEKGADPAWANDLVSVAGAPDLLILQEASPHTEELLEIAPDYFHSFAAGFRTRSAITGVMTVSSASPLSECNLVAFEPWFGTRKATLITEYALTNTDKTLLVVNIHGINFTFGVRDVEDQFREAQQVIAEHDGPVLFSGDFNTWRGERARKLGEIVKRVGLTPLDYDVDHRKRFLGWPLDHIYIRGLDAVNATTEIISSSDHNPMTVRLRVTDDAPRVSAAR